jgi:hypothetical protein
MNNNWRTQEYNRSPVVNTQLVGAIKRAMHKFPYMRLGQIIENAIPLKMDLFYMHDEDLIKYLDEFVEKYG